MKQRSIGFVGAIAFAMAPALLAAQQPTPPEPQTPPAESGVRSLQNRTVEGEVVEVNAQRLVVRTIDGNRMVFTVDRDLTTGSSAIAVGQRVRVEYSGEATLAVVNVARIPMREDLGDEIDDAADAVEDAAEETADAVEDAADEVEDAIDDDDPVDNGRTAAARVQTSPQPTAAERAQADRDELPDTASPLPALVLAGLALLGSGLGLSARRRE